jgi:hypothetical protein
MTIHPASGTHRFAHQAMATEFEIFCAHSDVEVRGYVAKTLWDNLREKP